MDENTKNETVAPPSWINQDFIQTAFQNSEDDLNLTIESVDVRAALAVGENYGSDMFRVEVKLEGASEKRWLIVKTLPQGSSGEMLNKSGIFPREINMFSDTLIKMHNILVEKEPGKFPPFSAKYLFHGDTPTKFIVLEDLTVAGFRNANRKKNLDLPHCSMVIQYLARFHAASVALNARDPKSLEFYTKNMYNDEMKEMFSKYLQKPIESLLVPLERWPECHSRYASKLIRFSDNVFDMLLNKFNYNPEKFSVLIHGDLWTNNIMFNYEQDRVVELRFVDFQISSWSSPAVDLQYFLHTSANEEVRVHHLDQLIAEYHNTLSDTLRLLGCNHLGVTLEWVKKEFDEYYCYGLNAVLNILPIIMADAEAAHEIKEGFANLSKGDAASNHIKAMYNNECYLTHLQKLLPVFEAKGCFDD